MSHYGTRLLADPPGRERVTYGDSHLSQRVTHGGRAAKHGRVGQKNKTNYDTTQRISPEIVKFRLKVCNIRPLSYMHQDHFWQYFKANLRLGAGSR